MTDYQKAIIDSPKRFTICEASTKVGKTVSHIVWLIEQALQGQSGQNYWWIAPVYGQSRIAFERIKRYLPKAVIKQSLTSAGNESITLINGAVIMFKSADKVDNLYGEDVYAVVLDEFTRCKPEVWPAIRSLVTATGAKVKFIGNVKGKTNWGHQLAMQTRNNPDWDYFKVTAWDAVNAGILSRAEVETAQRDLPDPVFRALYLAEPDDASNPYGFEAIDRQVVASCSGETIIYGIDVASKADYTVITGLNKEGGISYYECFQDDWDVIKSRIAALPKGAIYIDATGVGAPIADSISKIRRVVPFIFTSTSRQSILVELGMAIKQGAITYLKQYADEMSDLSIKQTTTGQRYQVPDGVHDDHIMSLALAWHGYQNRLKHTPTKFVKF
ncbi:MAG: hypothetical protein EBX40_03080 [Gammaproteobacteria bacterium]|nr:hypothetical protein [Gammaproteobacteria bacterium]